MQKRADRVTYSDFELKLLNKYEALTKKNNGYYIVHKTKFRANKRMRKKHLCGVFSQRDNREIVPCEYQQIFVYDDGFIVCKLSETEAGNYRWQFGYYNIDGECVDKLPEHKRAKFIKFWDKFAFVKIAQNQIYSFWAKF